MPPEAAEASAVSEAAQTQALIRQITSEARSAGQSLVGDPEAGVSDDDADAALGRRRTTGKPTPKDKKPAQATEATDAEGDEADGDAEETEGDETDEEEAEEKTPGEYDGSAIQAALDAEGGVDMVALAKALGKTPEELGVGPGQHKALRVAQRKAASTLKRADELADKLKAEYGDRVAARRSVETGDINPAIECCEAIFGMSWNELNRAVTASLSGKPLPDIEEKRQLRELKKKDAEREAEKKKTDEAAAASKKTEDAKAWIAGKIKGDKLASPEFNKLLTEAGFPSITDLVFDELRQGYSKGLTDPKKALEKVKARLTKQAKALAAGELIATPKPTPKPAVSASRPRDGAQAGVAGKARPMTDAELRASVLKEHGLLRK